MSQFVFRTLFILLQTLVGAIVLRNEVQQRLEAGRGGLRVPQKRKPLVFVNDLFFWSAVLGWVAVSVTWFFFPQTRGYFLQMTVPPVETVQWVGLLTALLASSLITAGIINLGSSFRTSIDHDETPTLVTHGIYTIIRNPMALGLLLHGWAGFLLHQSWIALVAAVVLHITNRLRVHFEESYLRRTLGDPYIGYCKQTGRFFPKL